MRVLRYFAQERFDEVCDVCKLFRRDANKKIRETKSPSCLARVQCFSREPPASLVLHARSWSRLTWRSCCGAPTACTCSTSWQRAPRYAQRAVGGGARPRAALRRRRPSPRYRGASRRPCRALLTPTTPTRTLYQLLLLLRLLLTRETRSRRRIGCQPPAAGRCRLSWPLHARAASRPTRVRAWRRFCCCWKIRRAKRSLLRSAAWRRPPPSPAFCGSRWRCRTPLTRWRGCAASRRRRVSVSLPTKKKDPNLTSHFPSRRPSCLPPRFSRPAPRRRAPPSALLAWRQPRWRARA